jgi:predicted DNA-binding transcriptional regulator YafY
MSDQAARLIEMLRAIPREGKVSTSDLVRRLEEAGFSINARSVQRDLERLSQLYPLISDTRSKPYGWKWSPDAKVITLPGLGEAEALTFHLVEKHLEGLLPASTASDLQPYFRAAHEKLSTSSERSPLGGWARRIRVVAPQQHFLPPKIDRDVRRSVTQALLRGRQLEITYQAPWSKVAKKHSIHPLGLIQYGAAFYLCVRFYDYPHPRMIALHRILNAEIVDKPVKLPPGFDLDQWIDDGAFGFGELGKPIKLDIEFRDHAGDYVLETPLSTDQKATETGDTLRIRATVMETERLRWWIMGFGARAIVHGPMTLRDDIARQHREAAASYAKDALAATRRKK